MIPRQPISTHTWTVSQSRPRQTQLQGSLVQRQINVKTGRLLKNLPASGAADRTRTGTVSLPADFKSALSTYSNTAACESIVTRIRRCVKRKNLPFRGKSGCRGGGEAAAAEERKRLRGSGEARARGSGKGEGSGTGSRAAPGRLGGDARLRLSRKHTTAPGLCAEGCLCRISLPRRGAERSDGHA